MRNCTKSSMLDKDVEVKLDKQDPFSISMKDILELADTFFDEYLQSFNPKL